METEWLDERKQNNNEKKETKWERTNGVRFSVFVYKQRPCNELITSPRRFTDCLDLSKVKLSLYRPRRPLGLREVEALTFSDIRLINGCKVVSPMRRPLFTPRKIPGTHFC
jgi:hypothetical protein